ncbi:hypothetical protein C6H88_02840 [Chlamydia muridarum str. Nigg]|uniref:Membrane protein n=1 Tax=Chlamydia muridarum TaxID=83560 RepID=A0A070A0H0_CHLMR|nr:hypothetical protein [Chlamydia muridarum]UFW37691.1 hypothetical protein FTM86_02965 [Chlamydia trachomatis]AHH22938.1 membrane protein [Chlamydia muridarum str. Nigg3 CMUT3-5]AHH23863.1 membrane protein [Chlamydia muridarum str. Nigg CM972]AID38071.1 membrane protein [Chlamydia muridarum str. Nigg 2 MCR]AIT90731.1 membrane protein [Chlamydia muridarum]
MSERKVENVTRPKRNKLLKFLRIKNSVIYSILIFVIRQIFPVLCCICKTPGKSICLSCWRRCSRRVLEKRCSRCLETMNVGESIAVCSACANLPCYNSLYLYDFSPETLALYRCACMGNVSGEQSFSKAASRSLMFNQCSIDRIIFFSKDIERSVAVAIAKHLKVPYEKSSFFKRQKILSSTEKLCILSIYPLDKMVREKIICNRPAETIFISLFLLAD